MDFQLPPLAEGIDSGTIVKILVKPGDVVKARQEVLQIETEKASMPVSIDRAGTISEVRIKIGDKISVGHVVLTYEPSGAPANSKSPTPAPAASQSPPAMPKAPPAPPSGPREVEFAVPDLGEGIAEATVIKIMVKVGDTIKAKQSLFSVETSKANMSVDSPGVGKVNEIRIKIGDNLKPGQIAMLLTLEGQAVSPPPPPPPPGKAPTATAARSASVPHAATPTTARTMAPPAPPSTNGDSGSPVPAGPATRRYAREMNVDLRQVSGSARGGRVTTDDVKSHIRTRMSGSAPKAGGGSPSSFTSKPLPDFEKWGAVERKAATGIRKAIAENMTHNWLTCPSVTQFDNADITELEDGRKRVTASLPKESPKITMTVLAVKAVVAALKSFPQFNVSYDAASGEIIQKKYYHIGIAVDTPRGLVVPVIRDADKKGLREIAEEVTTMAGKAREGTLSLDEMRGGCFTITNLGGIGGACFTPIINWPEAAILGMSRSSMQPVYRDRQFVPRLILPLSLTYDHRVIDGADGARFTTQLVQILSDPIRLLMES